MPGGHIVRGRYIIHRLSSVRASMELKNIPDVWDSENIAG